MRRMWSKGQVENVIQKAIDSEEIKLYEDMDIASALSITFGSLSDMEATKKYCSIRRTKENELYIVVNFMIKNNSASSQTLANNIGIYLSLDSEIAKLIYDINGKSVNDSLTTPAAITSCIGFTNQGSAAGFHSSRTIVFNNSTGANACFFQVRDGGNIVSNAEWDFTFRLFLTL